MEKKKGTFYFLKDNGFEACCPLGVERREPV